MPAVPELVLPNIAEFTPQELMAMEKETTGLYLSGHPMDAYRELVRRQGAVTIGSILNDFDQEGGARTYRDEQKVTVAGIVSAHKTKTTRNNSLMAYVTLEDDTGSMELLVFSRVLGESGSYIKENSPILVSGKISVRDEKEPQVLCDAIRPLSDLEQRTEAVPGGQVENAAGKICEGNKLYIKIPAMNDPRMKKITAILDMFPGEHQAVLYFEDCGKRWGTPCAIYNTLVRELKELLGEDSVVVK